MVLGYRPRSLAESPGAPGTKELFGEPEGRGVATRWPWAPRALPASFPATPSRTFHCGTSWNRQPFVYASSSAWWALSLILTAPLWSKPLLLQSALNYGLDGTRGSFENTGGTWKG